MAERLFGTDGIRGTANRHPMTAHVAADVAMATHGLGGEDDDPLCRILCA